MKHLILGGVRSGKSRFAEQCAKASARPVCYLATADQRFGDGEMNSRIERHRLHRPKEWNLVEETHDLAGAILKQSPDKLILVECLTLWLTNLLIDERSELERRRREFLTALEAARCDIILVSNEVGWGIIPENALARRFVDEAGNLHQAVAAICDRVSLVCAGLPHTLKDTK